MQIDPPKALNSRGFTLAEVLIAVVVCAVFGAAAFATNQRLLLALKNQKETTAATLVLQERMEAFRGTSYSNLANKDYVKQNILTFNPAASPSPTPAFPAGGQYTTFSEGALPTLIETVTVKGYQAASGYSPVPASDYNTWTRNMTTGDHKPHEGHTIDTLATNYDLLQVDILLTWTGADGRARTRKLSSVFGKGNIGS